MIRAIKNYISPKEKQFQLVTPNVENLLNKIIWGPFVNDLIVWYNADQKKFIEEGYQKNAMVYAIIRKIADKAKTADLQVFKPNGQKAAKDYRSKKYSTNEIQFAHSKIVKRKQMDFVQDSDPLATLLRNPNRKQSIEEFIDEVATWFYTTGEVFIYGVGPGEDSRNFGKYRELYCLPSHLVEIKMDTTGINLSDPVLGYKLSIGDQWITIPKEDVLHIKETTLEWDVNGSQLRGQPRLLAGAQTLLKNNLGTEAGAKSNKNQGAKGIVSPNVNNPELFLDSVQREKLDQGVEERINGTSNRDKVVASGLPLQYTQIGLSPVAMDLIASMNYDDEKLCGLWGVHPVIFRPTATRAELEVAQKSLVTDVILPFLNLLERKLESWLNPKFGTDYLIEFDVSSFPEMQPDVKLIMDAYKDNATITKNELRVMLGWDELQGEGVNTLWVDSNKMPIEEAVRSLAADFSDFQQ